MSGHAWLKNPFTFANNNGQSANQTPPTSQAPQGQNTQSQYSLNQLPHPIWQAAQGYLGSGGSANPIYFGGTGITTTGNLLYSTHMIDINSKYKNLNDQITKHKEVEKELAFLNSLHPTTRDILQKVYEIVQNGNSENLKSFDSFIRLKLFDNKLAGITDE